MKLLIPKVILQLSKNLKQGKNKIPVNGTPALTIVPKIPLYSFLVISSNKIKLV